jgi:hypothetical protein
MSKTDQFDLQVQYSRSTKEFADRKDREGVDCITEKKKASGCLKKNYIWAITICLDTHKLARLDHCKLYDPDRSWTSRPTPTLRPVLDSSTTAAAMLGHLRRSSAVLRRLPNASFAASDPTAFYA